MDALRKQLIAAAINGDVDKLEALCAAGAEIGQRIRGELTPLFWAATFGQAECVQALLGQGASANEQYGNGDSILICTVKASNVTVTIRSQPVASARFLQTIQLLVAHHADVDYRAPASTKHPDGYTALSVAKKPDLANLLQKAETGG